jgi:serine protease Do
MDLINRDMIKDLAYFHVRMDKSVAPFVPAKIILSQALVRRGDMVLVFGAPVPDKASIITQGLISSLNQSIMSSTAGSSLTGLIEVTTQLQNGYSGGPIVNLSGEVIGITTALSGNHAGIGWATPIDRSILNKEFEY